MTPTLEHKHVLLCAGPDFEDREMLYPFYRFQEAGAQVTVAGLGDTVYTGKCGVPITCHGTYADYINEAFDAVIIPGGWAPDKIRMDENALNIVRKAVQRGAVVAAICHGGWVLSSADVVQGRQVTSYVAIKDDLIHAGAHWLDQAVVVDGALVTSRKPDDLPAFCHAIIGLLSPVAVSAY
jgi:protease I